MAASAVGSATSGATSVTLAVRRVLLQNSNKAMRLATLFDEVKPIFPQLSRTHFRERVIRQMFDRGEVRAPAQRRAGVAVALLAGWRASRSERGGGLALGSRWQAAGCSSSRSEQLAAAAALRAGGGVARRGACALAPVLTAAQPPPPLPSPPLHPHHHPDHRPPAQVVKYLITEEVRGKPRSVYGMRLKNNMDNRRRAAFAGFDMFKTGGAQPAGAGGGTGEGGGAAAAAAAAPGV